jgi:hypothetical protein
MQIFHYLACISASELLGRDASNPISTEELAGKLETAALADPELEAYYRRLIEAGSAIEALIEEREAA